MTKLHRERLAKMAEVLENFSGETQTLVLSGVKKFDINRWTCGTAACAGGLAMLHPWFRRRGLRSDEEAVVKKLDSLAEVTRTVGIIYPRYQERGGAVHLGMDALAAFFGLDGAVTASFFAAMSYPGGKPTAKIVARKIRKYLDLQQVTF